MADYCTATQVKAAGRLNITTSTYDTELAAIVTAASRWVDRVTWGIDNAFAASGNTSRYYRGDSVDNSTLYLDAPLISVNSLTNGDSATITSANYWLMPRNSSYYWSIRLKSTADGWNFDTDGEVIVNGVWGFSTTVPDAVREATAMLSGWMFKRYQAALQDNTANPEMGQIIYGEAIPKQVMALLEPYKQGPR